MLGNGNTCVLCGSTKYWLFRTINGINFCVDCRRAIKEIANE